MDFLNVRNPVIFSNGHVQQEVKKRKDLVRCGEPYQMMKQRLPKNC